MIVNDNTEWLARVDDVAGHLDIGLAGGRVAAGVVVNQDQGRGPTSRARFMISRG